LLLLLLPL